MNSQPLHHPPSAPACQAAPTATLPAPPPPSQTTARTQLATAHVSDMASPEAATESSSTVEDPAVATVTNRRPAVPPMEKITAPVARAETESWSDDDSPNFLKGEGSSEVALKEKHTSHSFFTAIYLFAHLIPRQAGFLVRDHTKPNPRPRGHDVPVVPARFRCYDKLPHVL